LEAMKQRIVDLQNSKSDNSANLILQKKVVEVRKLFEDMEKEFKFEIQNI